MADLARSPLPGMDPWMELRWGDTHGKLAAYAADALNAVLPANYRAMIEERIVLDPINEPWESRPDVMVLEDDPHGAFVDFAPRAAGASVAAEPALVDFEPEPFTEHFVEVRDDDDALVTSVEWVSPTNKIDPKARRQFRSKRDRVHRRGANTVEIDLTRAGGQRARARLLRPLPLREELRTAYVAVARRGREPMRAEVYALSLRDRLPAIRIPLRPSDADVPLDLQALIDAVWRNGRYWQTDYARPLDPPLSPPDAAWAAGLVEAWRAGVA